VNLVFLAGDFPPAFGGIQKLCYGLCQALVAAGHDLRVIASAQPGDRRTDGASGLPTIRCRAPSRLSAALNMARALRRLGRGGPAPDAIIATKWSPEGQAYLLSGLRSRCPLVLMGYGREFLPEPGRRLRAWAQRAVLRASRGAIVISRFTAAQMRAAGVPPGGIRIVPPGIDPTEFPPPAGLAAARQRLGWPNGPTVLTIARLVRRKGVDTVIEALPAIARAVPDVHHVVLGGGPESERLTALAETLGVRDRVRFLGSLSDHDKAVCLHLCDVMAMPSRDLPSEPPEGFGIVYLEANLCGKPVVAADTGGVADAVEEGTNGILVQPDRPDQIAEAVVRLLTDPGLARSLGEAGRRRAAERFAWSAIAPQFTEAVGQLIGRESASEASCALPAANTPGPLVCAAPQSAKRS